MTILSVLALLTACGGEADPASPAGPPKPPSTASTSPKVALPTDPCELLTDEEVEGIMGWPSTADVRGAALDESARPTCWWTTKEDRSPNGDKLSLVLTTWSAVVQDFANPRAVVRETDHDRIRTLAFGDLHPLAVVRFGEDAVLVGVFDGSPNRADPVDIAERLLETFSE